MRWFQRILLLVLLSLFGLTLPKLSNVVAQGDCGSGIEQRLEVGGQGRVVPGQLRNRLRESPGGDQVIGFVEPEVTFTVLGGPECNDGISWWQVRTSDGQQGWTAEGVDGQAFLEAISSPPSDRVNVDNSSIANDDLFDLTHIQRRLTEALYDSPADIDLREPIVNTNDDCTSREEPRLSIGQHVKLVENPTQLEVFYGHPQIEGRFYSGKRLLQHAAYLRELFRGRFAFDSEVGRFISLLYHSGGTLVEGPECFNGNYLWKVESRESTARDSSYRYYLSYWVYEGEQSTRILDSINVQEPILTGFRPIILELEEQASAPIVSALDQVSYLIGGGGGGFFLGDWSVEGCPIGAGLAQSSIEYRASQCLTIYPFDAVKRVTVRIIQPDGKLHSEANYLPHETQAQIQYSSDRETLQPLQQSLQIYALDVMLPDDVGLPAGMWHVVAEQDNHVLSRAYKLYRPTYPVFLPMCKGVAVEYWLGNIPSNQIMDVILYEQQRLTLNISEGTQETSYVEAGRWTFNTGNEGQVLLRGKTQLPNPGVLVLVETGARPEPVNGLDAHLNQPYPPECEAPATAEAAPLLEYGHLYANTLGDNIEEQHYYKFHGYKDDLITIRLGIPDYSWDPHLQLLSPTGTIVSEGTSSSFFTNYGSIIEDIALTDDDFYTIVVQDRSETISGRSYTLFIESNSQRQDLSYGVPVTGAIDGQAETHSFFGTQGDEITIAANSTDIDVQIRLLSSNGDILAFDDDGGDNFLDAQISKFTLPETGIYTVEVFSWNNKTGNYRLEIKQ